MSHFTYSKTLALCVALVSLSASAQQTNPEGLWRNIDEKTGTPRSEIRLEVKDGVLSGRVLKSLRAGDDPGARCTKCSGERKDQPIAGMVIMSGLRLSTSNPLLWENGEIVDPDNGSVYRARIQLAAGGKSLEMRGYVGAPLFGRTQIWQRAE